MESIELIRRRGKSGTSFRIRSTKSPKRGVAGRSAPQLEDGVKISAKDVSNMIKDNLARFKQPKRIEFVQALPRNAMGKVQKNVLREAYDGVFQ